MTTSEGKSAREQIADVLWLAEHDREIRLGVLRHIKDGFDEFHKGDMPLEGIEMYIDRELEHPTERQVAPKSEAQTWYRPNPITLYRCPYCNEDGRLIDAGMVVDSWMNVCHAKCLPGLERQAASAEDSGGKR